MCRMLSVTSDAAFECRPHLEKLAEISRVSKEYQGHGWGCSWWEGGSWRHYKNLRPIWEDDLSRFGPSTRLVAHARSASLDCAIVLEYNQPFHDDKYVYAFNGGLRGVTLKAEGRIGAEKIFNLIKRLDKGDMVDAMRLALKVIDKRTKYIRAINVIIADKDNTYMATMFNEDAGYFQMHHRQEGSTVMLCSQPYPGESGWTTIPNGTVKAFQ
jgi:glutamine amidotransferase